MELIENILKAKKLADLIDVKSDLKKSLNDILKKIHPDICKDPNANLATNKLLELKEEFLNGKKYIDESGEFKTNGYFSWYSENKDLIKKSLDNFNLLKSYKDEASLNFHKYMPEKMEIIGGKLEVKFNERAIPITDLQLPQKHVNWILSRILEFASWLNQMGYSHNGINPESIFIMPESHGIQVASYYLLSKVNTPVNGISGKYQHWYPSEMFSSKMITNDIDISLAKKTAIYLLGDKSGVGVKLRKDPDVNKDFLNFVISQHDESTGLVWKEYREILSKNFKKEFHILDL